MSYYCGECAVWIGSSDVDRYGRRWCAYSGRYEESNQNTYGCRGFVYSQRAVLTKICEILSIPTTKWYKAFDEVKENYIAPYKMEWLIDYCKIGPEIAQALDADANRKEVAKLLVKEYIEPAYMLWKQGFSDLSAMKYKEMVLNLANQYFG